MIHKFEVFFEGLSQDNILYYSPRLYALFSKIYNDISIDLRNLDRREGTGLMTFVDIDEDNPGYLTFIKGDTAMKRLRTRFDIPDNYIFDREEINSLWYNSHDILYTTSRNSIKLGKFINKVLNYKYNSKEIETYTNEFKSQLNKEQAKFELVSGKDIAYWYDGKNYETSGSTLGNSCMASKIGYFDIYTKNPQSCQLLILKRENKILGRALVWKLDYMENNNLPSGLFFMDRIYVVEDYLIKSFENYANEMGWVYRDNRYDNYNVIKYKGYTYKVKMEVKVKPLEYGKYPFMDTFKTYDSEKGILYNSLKRASGHYLTSTGGGITDSTMSASRRYIRRFRQFFSSE